MKRILVVEDEAPVRLLVEKILTMAGYEVTTAADGKKAIAAARTCQPDVVVCDLTMPAIDGYQLCSMFKRDKSFRAPIIVLSGRVRDKDVKAALDAGADAFLSKPVNREELLAKIAELIPPTAPAC
jgi:CheY-like chemotaxis protein